MGDRTEQQAFEGDGCEDLKCEVDGVRLSIHGISALLFLSSLLLPLIWVLLSWDLMSFFFAEADEQATPLSH